MPWCIQPNCPRILLALSTESEFDPIEKRLRGYAWDENVGWIYLDDAEQFVGVSTPCPNSPNDDGDVDILDYEVLHLLLAGPNMTTPLGPCTESQFMQVDFDCTVAWTWLTTTCFKLPSPSRSKVRSTLLPAGSQPHLKSHF